MPQFDDIHIAVIIFVESVEFVADFFEPRIPRINTEQPSRNQISLLSVFLASFASSR